MHRLGGPTRPILLDATLMGGQAFRWRPTADGAFEGVVEGELWRLRAGRVRGSVVAEGAASARDVGRYFRMGDPYAAALARFAEDPVLAPAVARYRGLRVLRQDPWEALAAFITSANNNVKRITLILDRLSAAAGEPRTGPLGAFRAFPAPEAVAALGADGLRKVGLGYRAPFIARAAEAVAGGRLPLARLRSSRVTLEAAREALLEAPGVGPKVADCVALFALDKTDAFPVDRWVERAVSRLYHGGRALRPREVEAFARERWGEHAGLAQQFLFHAARMDKSERVPVPKGVKTRAA